MAAASSSFQAGPRLLKALSRRTTASGHGVGILPSWMGRANQHHTPYWAVVLFLIISAIVTTAAGAHDQQLVLYYAVSVFMSFLVGPHCRGTTYAPTSADIAGADQPASPSARKQGSSRLGAGPSLAGAPGLMAGSGPDRRRFPCVWRN